MDPRPDAARDAGCVPPGWTYTPANVSGCDYQLGTTDWNLFDNVLLDTSTTPPTFMSTTSVPTPLVLAQPGGEEVVVLVVRNMTQPLGRVLFVTGTRGLIIIANGDVAINRIDANAQTGIPGPGGQDCMQASQVGSDANAGNGGGGGGGGTFGFDANGFRAGAAGGRGFGATAGGQPGLVIGSPTLIPLRGGCSGGQGGVGDNGALPSLGGGGGGAIQISARGLISVDGEINVNGGGAKNSTTVSGGAGGGGSGGAILLEGTSVTINGALCANGGGGGASGDALSNEVGLDGNCLGGGRGGLTNPAGGSTSSGGDGASRDKEAIPGGTGETVSRQGGGGGGGGVGRIHINGTLIGTPTISPTPM